MANIIIGFVLIAVGVWGLVGHWYGFIDLLRVAVPSALTVVGTVAVMAGLKK